MISEDLVRTQGTLHKHAFWLYGVIAGLAIKEALTVVVPHILSCLPPEACSDPRYNRALAVAELHRLLVFLIVIVRFYVGSAFFFESAHLSLPDIEPRNYAKDFLSGIFHFVMFFVWAFSIDVLAPRGLWLFPAILAIILFYDILWYCFSHHLRNHNLLIFWLAINIVTLVGGSVLYLVTRSVFTSLPTLAEEVALWVVILASLEDLRVMLTGTESYSWQVVDKVHRALRELREKRSTLKA